MRRRMFRAQVKASCKAEFVRAIEETGPAWLKRLQGQGIQAFTLFEKDNGLFLYMESADSDDLSCWTWPDRCVALLEAWPGEDGRRRFEVPMLDIFHDGDNELLENLQAGRERRERIGSLARLKPEMYGSYVFYHYAMQEERPNGFNPTYMIGAQEQLLFSYEERPAPGERGGASRRTWPAPIVPDNWHEVMEPHFRPWPGDEQGSKLWVKMNLILSY
ncbi:L-rhamnose mutarotase [Paenibacillus phyllosphaerae]|uniref:L-rhamnose mutarotase n=1 Tax=Paenibacillus phyllosphaerae TaxID=274593 RepID=A0A7W5B4Y9_9BACL|nr:hypothetical protein [Paenibacillus phyllosphaerae]MBB3114483.1 L-rhamnose mutarotase [Paenibacillus phyllosphaerae]